MPIIEIIDLTYVYLPGTPYEKTALRGVSFSIEKGEMVGFIGVNGSGKSTLIQHFNGLLVPTAGKVRINGQDTSIKRDRDQLWRKVGMVFQFPEQQMFEISVFSEMAYGLRNLGLDSIEIDKRIADALLTVGLNPQEVINEAPPRLSGGIRRRVALASILAMGPEILILDEPTAGLDPLAGEYIMKAVNKMRQEYQTTIIIVSHQVSDILLMTDKLAFLEDGRLAAFGDKSEVIGKMALSDRLELVLPDHLQLLHRLASFGYPVNTGLLALEDVAAEIDRMLMDRSR